MALVLILRNLIWQYQNGFPVLTHMRLLSSSKLVNYSRLGFLMDQLLFLSFATYLDGSTGKYLIRKEEFRVSICGIDYSVYTWSFYLFSGKRLLCYWIVPIGLYMAVGEYVSVSSQTDTENADITREAQELKEMPEIELDILTQIYEKRGLKKETAAQVAKELTQAGALGTNI